MKEPAMFVRCWLLAAIVSIGSTTPAADTQVRVVDRPAAGENGHYVGNRAPFSPVRSSSCPSGRSNRGVGCGNSFACRPTGSTVIWARSARF